MIRQSRNFRREARTHENPAVDSQPVRIEKLTPSQTANYTASLISYFCPEAMTIRSRYAGTNAEAWGVVGI